MQNDSAVRVLILSFVKPLWAAGWQPWRQRSMARTPRTLCARAWAASRVLDEGSGYNRSCRQPAALQQIDLQALHMHATRQDAERKSSIRSLASIGGVSQRTLVAQLNFIRDHPEARHAFHGVFCMHALS